MSNERLGSRRSVRPRRVVLSGRLQTVADAVCVEHQWEPQKPCFLNSDRRQDGSVKLMLPVLGLPFGAEFTTGIITTRTWDGLPDSVKLGVSEYRQPSLPLAPDVPLTRPQQLEESPLLSLIWVARTSEPSRDACDRCALAARPTQRGRGSVAPGLGIPHAREWPGDLQGPTVQDVTRDHRRIPQRKRHCSIQTPRSHA